MGLVVLAAGPFCRKRNGQGFSPLRRTSLFRRQDGSTACGSGRSRHVPSDVAQACREQGGLALALWACPAAVLQNFDMLAGRCFSTIRENPRRRGLVAPGVDG